MSRKNNATVTMQHTEQFVGSGVGTAETGWIRCMLTAEMLSDAHLGSGSGGSGIDALVARDRHDRPVIWASHVEGVLRDAARRLWGDDVACDFFGRAGGSRQRAVFTSLYADENFETREPRKTRIWRSTARKAFDNAAPKDDTLRVIEYIPKGARFVGKVELSASELPRLQRLVQEVDALGGGRATGAGRVKLTLRETPVTSRKVGDPTERLLLLLKNLDPLCITATATPDNLIPSLAFVPGRALLGAIAAWLIAEGDRETASLLTLGRISVSDALPLPHSPKDLAAAEVLPAPLTLQSEKPKGTAGEVPWWAEVQIPTRRVNAWSVEEKLKRPEDDLFVYRDTPYAPWTAFRPKRRVRLRNGRPDPRQADVSLFAIEQIVEETYFLAELRGAPEDMRMLAAKLAAILEGRRWLRLGRGGAPVEVAQVAWSRSPVPATVDQWALLTLTSDLLVRDDLLRWRTALDADALRGLLGVDVQVEQSMQDSVPVHGFNGTSRLWRMPAVAIRRGSVFHVSGTGVLALAERAARGLWLGERTHEGFGRFRVDATLPGDNAEVWTTVTTVTTVDEEEEVAATTQQWFEKHKSLAKPSGSGEDKPPSLSQWFDLVADLERKDPNAIVDRLSPKTAGARSWKQKDATAILEKLAALEPEQRALHARFFVRWLRAELRRNRDKRGA